MMNTPGFIPIDFKNLNLVKFTPVKEHHFLAFCISLFFLAQSIYATEYYIHPVIGDDLNDGLSPNKPFKTFSQIHKTKLYPGDKILLAAGVEFNEMLHLESVSGSIEKPIIISSYTQDLETLDSRAIINASIVDNGVWVNNSGNLIIENLEIHAKNSDGSSQKEMKCGILISTDLPGIYENISVINVLLRDIFIEPQGFKRGIKEVKTANGSQRYGWGIRVINRTAAADIKNILIKNCEITNISHTGIKLTSVGKHIIQPKVLNNRVSHTGGPGIQMSGGQDALFQGNYITNSGSTSDSRKWGRGSGLWVWGSANVLIEKNHFLYANGPGDSAGCHIDFNCSDVIVQYNISAHNAGGFCEILGNNYNCAYRYNISINDGFRIKGENGAFQEGKTFWLSGYAGNNSPLSGPTNSYFYNNTIYLDEQIISKVAVSNVAGGILIANNIFYVKTKAQTVIGDQNVLDKARDGGVNKSVFFKNNLYLNQNYWPDDCWIQDSVPIIGDPSFANPRGLAATDYIQKNTSIVKNKGIIIPQLPNDTKGLLGGLHPAVDLLGRKIKGKPDLGAIEVR